MPEKKDFIRRGSYASNPLGTATFIGLRSLDPFLQFQIITHATPIATKLGLRALPSLGGFGATSLAALPFPSKLILGMSAGSVVKQIIWLLFLSKEEFVPATAVGVSLYNSIVNSLMSLVFVTAATSGVLAGGPQIPVPFASDGQTVSLPIAIGTVAYVLGLALEAVSEYQRKLFKDDPANKGKICTTGLWAWARHINYGAYSVWRTGYALAAGSWPVAAAVAAWHAFTFIRASIPELDGYMAGRYGEQWKQYKRDVPYQLLPGIY